MTQSAKRFLFSAIAVVFLLTACIPGQAAQSPEEIANQISTAVALTVAAQNAQAEAAQPVATNTTLPTQTEAVPPTATPIIPTATPFVIVPPTATFSSGGSGGAPLDYDCNAINRRPFDNTVFHKNEKFDIKWTIVNTGTKTMRMGLDLKYFSGPDMTPGRSPIELPELKPGEKFTVLLDDAQAPDKKGFHVMTWIVEGQLCYPYVAIIVE